MVKKVHNYFELLKKKFEGDILVDELSKVVYATDASVYREKPLAVVLPKTKKDVKLVTEHPSNVASVAGCCFRSELQSELF